MTAGADAATVKNGPIVSAETRMKPAFAAKRALVTHPPHGPLPHVSKFALSRSFFLHFFRANCPPRW